MPYLDLRTGLAGRRPKISEEYIEEICGHIEAGSTNRDAALLSGIDEKTFYNWKNKGEKASSGLYFLFFQRLKKAEAEFKKFHLSRIYDAATLSPKKTKKHVKETLDSQGRRTGDRMQEIIEESLPPDWKASAWLLERKFPTDFGRQIVKHEGEVKTPVPQGPIKVIFVDPPEDPPADNPFTDEEETDDG